MYKNKTVTAIIAAAGSSSRMNRDKLLLELCGKSVIVRTVEVFIGCGFFDEVIIVSSPKNIPEIAACMEKYSLSDRVKIIGGGKTRGESSLCGIKEAQSEYVMIHDGARPLVSEEIIEKTLAECIRTGAAAVGVRPKDTIKQVDENGIVCTVPRESTVLIQTPQAFLRSAVAEAYMDADFTETDDCAVLEKKGAHISIVEGSYENIKLTTPEDLITAEEIIRQRCGERSNPHMRIGTGFDTHRLETGRALIIGGTEIPFEKGLLGHSDADVLIHAVIDALFGAAALGDIGTHFPDTDAQYKGISSMLLLERAAELVRENGFSIGNVDTTVIAQSPKLAPYIESMRTNLAQAMELDVSCVSVKAKSNEHMGFTGRGEGIEARAVAAVWSKSEQQ